MPEQATYWSIDDNSYRLFDMEARRINRFTWKLPKFGLIEPSPLTPKIQRLIERSLPYGEVARIEVTTLGGLKLMLEQQLTSALMDKAICLNSCLQILVKFMGRNRQLVIWSPSESRGRSEVVTADSEGRRLQWD